MTDINDTVDTWLDAWTVPDEATRRRMVRDVWAPDGTLVDPPMAAAGHDELTAVGAALQVQFPGHTFRRTTAIDAHHDLVRYGWALLAPDGSTALTGLDVAVVTADGKLQRVAGFFGELAAA
jgi:SnoaL-like domain